MAAQPLRLIEVLPHGAAIIATPEGGSNITDFSRLNI
jgi:hypothetical protein